MVYSAVLCAARTVMGSNPHQCLWTHDLQVSGWKRLSCYADLYTVSRCRTTGESEDHTSDNLKTHKQGNHPGFETQGRHHEKFKTEPNNNDWCSPIF